MAASKQAKKTAAPKAVWQARPDDAIRLGAMRWFALEIERKAIEIYATDSSKYPALEKALRDVVRDLNRLGKQVHSLSSDDDCPVGYVLCKDGLCAPMCDGHQN
jgi:hypothetical protein